MLWWTLRQLRSKNWKTRERAVEQLGESKDPRAVKPLVAALKHEDPDVRRAAAEALGNIGDARAVEPLLAALKDKDCGTRRRAAGGLGKIGDGRAVEPLIAALTDEGDSVREEAAEALGNIGDARAAEPLLAALKRSVAAGYALGKIGDARAVEPLVATLKRYPSDYYSDLRRRTAEALGYFRDARAVEALVAALNDKYPDVRRAAANALRNIADARAVEPLVHVRQEAASVSTDAQLGILFDTEELGDGLYGYEAYKIFFEALDTALLAGCVLSDGDTNATLAGRAYQYCIAVDSPDAAKIAAVKNALSASNAKGLLPLSSRFLPGAAVSREPLVLAARIDVGGKLVDCKTPWVMRAWEESRERHQGSAPSV